MVDALSVKTQGTMTDSLLFDIDETLSKVYKELASHQTRLDSFEQQRLEMMSVHRVLSLLPKPVLPSQGEDNYTWERFSSPYPRPIPALVSPPPEYTNTIAAPHTRT